MSWRRALLGLVVSAIFVALLLRQVDGPELRDAFADAQPGWLIGGFAVYLGALWLRGLRWRLVLREATPLSTNDATALVVIGYAANNVLPVRVGELVRAQLLHDRHGADRVGALGTIVVERILDGLVLALFLAGTIALAGGNGTLRALAAAMGVAFVILTLGLVLLGPWLASEPARALRLLRPAPQRLRRLAEPRVERFAGGLTTVRGTRAWGAILAVTAASWACRGGDVLVRRHRPRARPRSVALPRRLRGGEPRDRGAEHLGRDRSLRVLRARSGGGVRGDDGGRARRTRFALHALLLIPVVALGLLLLWRRHIAVRSLLRASPEDAYPRMRRWRPPRTSRPQTVERLRRTG